MAGEPATAEPGRRRVPTAEPGRGRVPIAEPRRRSVPTAEPGRRRVAVVLADSTGGIAAHVGSVVPRLLAAGFDIHLLAPAGVLGALVPAIEPDRARGRLSSAPVLIPASPWAASRPARWLRRGPASELRRQLAGVDLVHAHGLRAGWAAIAARRPGTPVVVSWHNPPPTGGLTGLAARVAVGRLVRATDITLGASRDLVAAARAAGAADARLCEVAAPAGRQVVSGEKVAAIGGGTGDRRAPVGGHRRALDGSEGPRDAAGRGGAARRPAPPAAGRDRRSGPGSRGPGRSGSTG